MKHKVRKPARQKRLVVLQSRADKTMVTERLGDRKEAPRKVPLSQSHAGKTMVAKQLGDGKELVREAPYQKF